jgi:hypothetical protein
MPTRRFPPPWSVEELDACYVVRVFLRFDRVRDHLRESLTNTGNASRNTDRCAGSRRISPSCRSY